MDKYEFAISLHDAVLEADDAVARTDRVSAVYGHMKNWDRWCSKYAKLILAF